MLFQMVTASPLGRHCKTTAMGMVLGSFLCNAFVPAAVRFWVADVVPDSLPVVVLVPDSLLVVFLSTDTQSSFCSSSSPFF